MNIGVLGGTFDPIHNGHIQIAEETRKQLDLAQVLFVPAGQPWLKEGNPILPAGHRVQMVRLAIAGYPYFKLSTIEVDRKGSTYTVDTLTELRAQYGEKVEIFFILGWDSLEDFPRWRGPSRIIELCKLVAVPRPGYSPPDVKNLEKSIPGLSDRLVILEKPNIDISATEIRERAAKRLSISRFVPEVVEEYIKKKKLYLSP